MDRKHTPSFNFVNLQHPDDLKSEETQLRIRRLAMTEVGKARRKPKTKRARHEILLEFRSPPESRVDIDRFGGGQLDPFSPYPVQLDDSDRALLANVFVTEDNNHPTVLRGSWYPVGLSNPAAFYSMLSNSQNFLFARKHGYFPSQDDNVALKYHHKALRHTLKQLQDPEAHQSEEIIGCIAAFMIHHTFLGNFTSNEWQNHANALLKVVALRGGYDTITTEHFRITVSWADLLASFFQDTSPVVPMPSKWIVDSKLAPNMPRPYNRISLSWKKRLPRWLDWVSIFDDIVQMISLDQTFNERQLMLAITSGSWTEPTLYRLLSIRPLENGSSWEYVMEEVCRLGTLLFLAPTWRALGQTPVRTAMMSRKLLLVLVENMGEWNELKPLLVWALYFAAIETQDLGERSQFVLMLGIVMNGMHLQEWEEVMEIVKDVLWVEKVLAGTDELIRDEVMQIAHQQQQQQQQQQQFAVSTPGSDGYSV